MPTLQHGLSLITSVTTFVTVVVEVVKKVRTFYRASEGLGDLPVFSNLSPPILMLNPLI